MKFIILQLANTCKDTIKDILISVHDISAIYSKAYRFQGDVVREVTRIALKNGKEYDVENDICDIMKLIEHAVLNARMYTEPSDLNK